jgi:CheY-like chemotaxis protein
MGTNSKGLVLIVDDSVGNQTLLRIILESIGYQVYCASNGDEALCLLRELTHLPNLIFLDAQMPIMDGYQFRLEQKLNPRLKSIPVVVMTGDSNVALQARMLQPEVILIKPLEIDSIVASANQF